MPLRSGDKLSHYEILAPAGKGAMGEVYRARDSELGREVAIKVLPDALGSDLDRLKRFEQEARAASALNHPNIVTVHEIGTDGATRFLVMELVSGISLRELIDGVPLDPRRLRDIASQLADGLAAAHEAGIVHRDLKPDNVMVTEDGRVKVLDFGLAKLIPPELESENPTAELMTAPGATLGTVAYMSPEQARGANVDHRSDQFALGVMLYEMASGVRPFRRETPAQTMAAILDDDAPPLKMGGPQLKDIVARCLSKDPSERYPSTRDLADGLKRLEVSEPSVSPWRKMLVAATALLVVTVGFGAYVLRDRNAAATIESIAVLPLDNLSGDPGEDYFVDGMTEALIAELASVDELKVISRTSSMRFKDSDVPLPEIARELGVDAVVEGSAMRVDDQVRITAQLIEASTDEHLWAESYERDIDNVLALQRNVAEAIASELGAVLAVAAQPSPAVDPTAYDAYLKGMYHFHRRSLIDARAYFEEATRLQPDYALAYVGIALSSLTSRQLAAAEAALDKAEAIAPELPEAYPPRCILLATQWQWREAVHACDLAVERMPASATAHHFRGNLLMRVGRYEEAVRAGELAAELDPLSAIIVSELAARRLMIGNTDAVPGTLDRALELDPLLGQAYSIRAAYFRTIGRFEEALEASQRAAEVGFAGRSYSAGVAYSLALLGRDAEAREMLRSLGDQVALTTAFVQYAAALFALGDDDRGFRMLEAAAENRNPDLYYITLPSFFDDALDSVRDHPRFQAVVEQLGILN